MNEDSCSINYISEWIQEKIGTEFHNDEALSVWIFGSILHNASLAHDIDVLIVVPNERAEHLALISPMLRQNFLSRFGLPLHLTRLTQSEFENSGDLVAKLLKSGAVKVSFS